MRSRLQLIAGTLKLARRLAVPYLRVRLARRRMVRAAARALVEQGLPPDAARQLAGELPRLRLPTGPGRMGRG